MNTSAPIPIDIRPRDLETVVAILVEILPVTARVRVFGSRAAGRARRGSDLDLAIDAGRLLAPSESTALVEAFDDSDLPYDVDIDDMWAIGEGFAEIVRRDRVPLSRACASIEGDALIGVR